MVCSAHHSGPSSFLFYCLPVSNTSALMLLPCLQQRVHNMSSKSDFSCYFCLIVDSLLLLYKYFSFTIYSLFHLSRRLDQTLTSYDLGLSYHADPEVNPGWCAAGKFLFCVECAGCGSTFVQKAPPAQEGGGKERGDPQVPSTNNAVYCCNNLCNQNGSSDEGCSHAYCKCCWDAGLLEAAKSGVRASRRTG